MNTFATGRHNNCNIITYIVFINQNLLSLDRRNVRDNCNLIILFEQRGKALTSIYQVFLLC